MKRIRILTGLFLLPAALGLVGAAAARPACAEASPLEAMQGRLQAVFEQAAPSVVGVVALTPQQRMRIRLQLPSPPGEKATEAQVKTYQRKLDDALRKLLCSGSGFVYDRDGHVVTSTRAVPPSLDKAYVIFHDGAVERAPVVGRADAYNVVLLRVERRDLTPARLGGETALGQPVISVGNVFDITYRMRRFAWSVGTVTGLYDVKAGRGFTTFYSGPVIETDAAVNPGIFGGPLLDLKGCVVGMLSSTFAYQRFLGTAVPADRVRRGVQAVLHPETLPGRSFAFPSLGARILWRAGRASLEAVEKGSEAEEAGLAAGDVILLFNDTVPTEENLQGLIDYAERHGAAELRFERKGWEKTFQFHFRAGEGEDEAEDEDEF